jgi:hypothetical protein
MIRRLHPNVTMQTLLSTFSSYGHITGCKVRGGQGKQEEEREGAAAPKIDGVSLQPCLGVGTPSKRTKHNTFTIKQS